MLDLLSRGFESIRKRGILATVVATLRSFKSSLCMIYYKNTVEMTAHTIGPNLSVNGPSTVNRNTHLGTNVNFNGMEIRGDGPVIIGDNFHSGPRSIILTRNHNYNNGKAIPYDSTYNRKQVEIGDNVWFGIRVTVTPGVTIEEGAIIQAGSTVTTDIPKGAIAGGHPAKVFEYRDLDHYDQLKEGGMFH